jgi:hypothetical protein
LGRHCCGGCCGWYFLPVCIWQVGVGRCLGGCIGICRIYMLWGVVWGVRDDGVSESGFSVDCDFYICRGFVGCYVQVVDWVVLFYFFGEV